MKSSNSKWHYYYDLIERQKAEVKVEISTCGTNGNFDQFSSLDRFGQLGLTALWLPQTLTHIKFNAFCKL